MPEKPNELPEGGEGGGGGFNPGRWPGEFPQELPPWVQSVIRVDATLIAAIVQLRDRLHQLETAQIVSSLSGGARLAAFRGLGGIIGGPNELPEGSDGGGGGGVIHWPGEWPAELPVNRLVDLEVRLTNIESMISALGKQIEGIAKRG